MSTTSLLDRFERLDIDAPDFRHADHIKVAYEMLDKYDFLDACTRYATTIRTMAESVGAADKFNATITIAFMSLIAERMGRHHTSGAEAFLSSNQDLLDKDVLSGWYSAERLSSPAARSHFLLPDKAQTKAA